MLIVVIFLMLIGFIGIWIPGLPGIGLIFASALFYGFITAFEKITLLWIIIFAILTVLSFALDYLGSMVTAKKFGATKYGIIGGVLGALVGAIILNIPGLFIGQFVGTLSGELYGGKAIKDSAKAGIGGILGYFLGMAVNISIGVFMIGIFLFMVWR